MLAFSVAGIESGAILCGGQSRKELRFHFAPTHPCEKGTHARGRLRACGQARVIARARKSSARDWKERRTHGQAHMRTRARCYRSADGDSYIQLDGCARVADHSFHASRTSPNMGHPAGATHPGQWPGKIGRMVSDMGEADAHRGSGFPLVANPGFSCTVHSSAATSIPPPVGLTGTGFNNSPDTMPSGLSPRDSRDGPREGNIARHGDIL